MVQQYRTGTMFIKSVAKGVHDLGFFFIALHFLLWLQDPLNPGIGVVNFHPYLSWYLKYYIPEWKDLFRLNKLKIEECIPIDIKHQN